LAEVRTAAMSASVTDLRAIGLRHCERCGATLSRWPVGPGGLDDVQGERDTVVLGVDDVADAFRSGGGRTGDAGEDQQREESAQSMHGEEELIEIRSHREALS